mmetsp:Transcript_10737/g.22821  ORF Transcript_10737/g.22821 Transcript_10737/m.22821 type:complete len:82 (-) Transcript_10737:1123-1368(-)
MPSMIDQNQTDSMEALCELRTLRYLNTVRTVSTKRNQISTVRYETNNCARTLLPLDQHTPITATGTVSVSYKTTRYNRLLL